MNAEFKKLREHINPLKVGEYTPVTLEKSQVKELNKKAPDNLFYQVKAEEGVWTLKRIQSAEILSRIIRIEMKLDAILKVIDEAMQDEKEKPERNTERKPVHTETDKP